MHRAGWGTSTPHFSFCSLRMHGLRFPPSTSPEPSPRIRIDLGQCRGTAGVIYGNQAQERKAGQRLCTSGKARRPNPMSWSRATCPACKVERIYGPGKRTSSSGGEVPCPYLSLPFAELLAGHDRIYFGPWRRVKATQLGISVGRRPVPMQGMRVSVHLDDRLGRQPTFWSGKASPAGVVRPGRAGVSAAVPGSGSKGSGATPRTGSIHSAECPGNISLLFMGEVCYRFNHRGEDLFPLLHKLLRGTSMTEIEPILVRLGNHHHILC